LPWGVGYDEINTFFKEYKYLPKSAEIGLNTEGRQNGAGCILFEDEG